ncbi:hypothetical protein DFR70_11140 [Nocardia tenerifensis]|uniref:Uncharacterized protein n=1 Tax=Nocardia tenerifensis TaxID=228006 RepID=A0A318K781_9NOCA|nr:hypothetical protein [Nocardia tenerifensis]PXX59658.1 hypothetical protein DFR70_11140 [Nocardia tenerifensis]
MRASDSGDDDWYEREVRAAVHRERDVRIREAAVAVREAAADARDIALEMRETTVEMSASGVSRREASADRREASADRREASADRREAFADAREAEYTRGHPPTAEAMARLEREALDRALAQLQRAEDAVARARAHLVHTEHLVEQGTLGRREDIPPQPAGD